MAAAYTSPDSVASEIATRTEMITSRMDEIIEKEIKTSAMTADSAFVEATGNAKDFKVATIDCSGLGNYSQEKGYQYGSAKLEWNTYTLKHDRGVVLDVDRLEQNQSGGLATTGALAARLTRGFINPEIDATRISGVYAALAANDKVKDTNVAEYTPAAATILSEIMKGIDTISEVWNTDSGYTIYISSAVKSLLRTSTEYTKVKDIASGAARLSTDVTEIEGNQVVWVPKFRMKTEYTYQDIDNGTTDGGIVAGSGAKDINFLIVAPGVANGVVSVNAEKYITKEVNQRKDADSLYVRVYHDVIVPKEAAVGAYVSVSPGARDDGAATTVAEAAAGANGYTYDGYAYTGAYSVGGSTVSVAYGASALSDPSVLMNDFARFMGALYRASGVTAVAFEGTTYRWDVKGTLKGSNYKSSSGATLVSAVTAWVQSNMASATSGSISLTLTLANGTTGTLTYAVSVAATASLSATKTTKSRK